MLIEGFDCYCKGEEIKNIKEIRIRHEGKIVKMPVFKWFSRGNYHFCYIIKHDGIKEYYYNECLKPIIPGNNTYDKIKRYLSENKNLWIKCKNNERIKEIVGLFYDLWGENLEVMDNTAFCRFSRNIMMKDLSIAKYILISNLKQEIFEKKLDEWMYISTIETLLNNTKNLVILALKGNFLKDFYLKEIKDNDIC